MMGSTARFGLPLLSAGQAQKEVFHNEALQTLDFLVSCAVEEPARNDPPASPALGSCYIVSSAPTGAWEGNAECLAAWGSGGWRFAPPSEGLSVFVRSSGTPATYRAGSWEVGQLRGDALVLAGEQVVGPRAAAIQAPTGGVTIDVQARAAIDQILGAMRAHGLIAT